MSGSGAPAGPARSNTATRIDKDGNRVQEWTGSGQPGIRTHDLSNEDDVNQRLFGSSSSRKNTSSYTDDHGDKVEYYSGEGSGPGLRTHDQSDESAINERLFGSGAPKPPSRTSTQTSAKPPSRSSTQQTHRYRNADGDWEEVAASGQPQRVRTHDYSNEDEINQKLFGSGVQSSRNY